MHRCKDDMTKVVLSHLLFILWLSFGFSFRRTFSSLTNEDNCKFHLNVEDEPLVRTDAVQFADSRPEDEG